uniref:Glycosyl transferase family 25 domain-containing protein n=1 Tax=viral metagenome TaxID=1070528 RepID=A0A6C0DSV1_9ZZZZ
MNHIDSVYCINLRRRRDRLTRFLERFPKAWLPKLRIFGAVDGRNHVLTEDDRWSLRSANWEIEKGRGQWGCSFSHVAIWKEVVKTQTTALVLEDDAIFSGSLDVLSEAIQSMQAASIGLLYAGPSNHPENTATRPHNFTNLVAPRICSIDRNLGTMSYIITPASAAELLQIIQEHGHYNCIDHIMNDYLKTQSRWVCISPPLFSMDPAGGSDIPPAPWRPLRSA